MSTSEVEELKALLEAEKQKSAIAEKARAIAEAKLAEAQEKLKSQEPEDSSEAAPVSGSIF